MASLSSLNFRLAANIAPFQKGLNKAGRELDSFGRKMQQTGKSLSLRLTAPLTALGAVSFNVFKNFEAEMAKVKAVSGATAQEFKLLSDNAKALGASTQFSAVEVAGLQTEFAKLGFTATEITKVTEATLALAQASGSDLARSAEVAGSTLRAFGLDASQTSRVTDVMALSFSSSALDMEVFAESMKYVAPVAKSAGMSLEQTSAMLAVLANNGIKGSQAGTALRRIISELGSTGGDVEKTIKKLAEQGLNLADAKDEVGRSAQSALLILAEGADQINPLTESFKNSTGAAQEMADTMGETSLGASKRLSSALEGLGISLGEIIAEAVTPMIEGLASFVGWLNETSPTTKKLIVILGGLLAAIGPILFVVGGMIRNFRLLRDAMASSNAVKKIAIFLQKSFNKVLKANPIGIAITAITALAGAFAFLTSRQKQSTGLMEEMSDETRTLVAEIGVQKRQMNNLFEALKDANLEEDRRKLIIEELNTKYKDYLPNLLDEKTSIEDIAAAQKEANSQFKKKIATITFQDQIAQKTEKAVAAQKDLLKLQEEYTRMVSEGYDPDETGLAYVALGAAGVETEELFADMSVMGLAETIDYAEAVAILEGVIDKASDEVSIFENKINELGDTTKQAAEATVDLGDKTDDLADDLNGPADAMEKLRKDSESTVEHMMKLPVKKVATLGATIDGVSMTLAKSNQEMDQGIDKMDRMILTAKALSDQLTDLANKALVDVAVGFADMAGQALVGAASFADLGRFAIESLAGLMTQVGQIAVQTGIAVSGIKVAIQSLNPAVAIAGGLALIALAGAIKGKMSQIGGEGSIPAMAEGGIVTGPTLALIGEGRESEAVIPLSKLNSMMSGGSNRVEVYGRISGSDILLSQERAQRNRTRQRGF
jgi:phage-related minor tail protein